MRTTLAACAIASMVAVAAIGAAGQTQAQRPQSGAARPAPPATSSTAPRRQHVVTKLSGFDLADATSMARQTTMAGASRGGTTLTPLAPRLGRVFGSKPTFYWIEADASATVRVYNEDEEVVHEASAAGGRYVYDGPALRAGRTYYWTVERAGVTGSRSDMVGLRMVDAAERTEIASALPAAEPGGASAHLARAQLFVDRRLWYDALAAYHDAVAETPTSAPAHEGLAVLLGQLPQATALSDAEFAAADAIAGAQR
jgi:hypothetical protein